MSAVGARIAGAWDRFWFTPDTPRNLAAARILISAHALWVLLSRDLAGIAAAPADFWTLTVPATRLRYLLFPGHAGIEHAFQVVAALALVAAMLGVVPRVACLVAGVLLYHLAPLETFFWTPTAYARGFEISILALVTLSASRCGDALTVWPRRAMPAPSAEYRWPVVLMQVFVAQLYVFAGWSKLHQHGLAWADPEYIRRWLLLLNQEEQLVVFRRLGLWLASQPLACLAIGVGGFAMDLGFVLVLFSKRARMVLVPMAVLFHAVIVVTMNIFFLNVPQLLLFVDWEAVRRRRRPGAAPVPAEAPA